MEVISSTFFLKDCLVPTIYEKFRVETKEFMAENEQKNAKKRSCNNYRH